jgi:hypothetical protein
LRPAKRSPRAEPRLIIGLSAVIVAVTDDVPRVLTVRSGEAGDLALPSGPLDPFGHHTLERGLRAWVREQTGLELGYVEQLYTFGDRHRHPAERRGGPRAISVAYLALRREARPTAPSGAASAWRPWYEFLPWEDWRAGRPAVLTDEIEPALDAWMRRDRRLRAARRERVEIAFGPRRGRWDGERVLERYELLYEAGLVGESGGRFGAALAWDHRRILATALGRLRGKLRYRPVVFELLPSTFTLLRLQRVVEALAGVRLHKQNFRRLVEAGGLVEGTGRLEERTGGRPAERFRFRREVLRERPAPGVGLPAVTAGRAAEDRVLRSRPVWPRGKGARQGGQEGGSS